MGMKSYYVHCKNKFPEAEVYMNDSKLEVYKDGGLHILMEKNAHGQILDKSEELGLEGRFDLSPIPKESRAWKINKQGNVERDEKHDERRLWSAENAVDGEVKDYDYYKKELNLEVTL